MYKLIAVDMDGTLLNSKGEITEKSVDAIGKAVEKGVIFTISTGRPIQGVDKYNSVLQLKSPIITYNGAMIVHSQTREVLFEQGISPKDAVKILALGRKFNTTMCVWSHNQLYGNILNERIHDYKKLSGVEPILIENDQAIAAQGVTKILWYDEKEKIEQFQQELKHAGFSDVTYCTSKPVFLEFFSSKVSKSMAMEKIGEIYEIRREEMIAIGDGLNDLSMIEYAGLGVAMANADAEVKSKAQYITTSNDEDGVADTIMKFILSE